MQSNTSTVTRIVEAFICIVLTGQERKTQMAFERSAYASTMKDMYGIRSLVSLHGLNCDIAARQIQICARRPNSCSIITAAFSPTVKAVLFVLAPTFSGTILKSATFNRLVP
jgi:hypothetical protein